MPASLVWAGMHMKTDPCHKLCEIAALREHEVPQARHGLGGALGVLATPVELEPDMNTERRPERKAEPGKAHRKAAYNAQSSAP